MLEEQGRVISLEKHFAWVRTQRKSACGNCEKKSSCATGSLSTLQTSGNCDVMVGNDIGAKVGDQVIISMPDESLLSASIWMYFVPLLAMLATVIILDSLLQPSDWVLVITAALSLAGGFLAARIWAQAHQHDPQFKPTMTRIVSRLPSC